MAISIPIFTTQLERSREATDLANIRSAYAEATTDYLADPKKGGSASTTIRQQDSSWHIDHDLVTRVDGSESKITLADVNPGGTATVSVSNDDAGKATVSVTMGAAAAAGG